MRDQPCLLPHRNESENPVQALAVTLRPATSDCCIVADEDVGAKRYWLAFEESIEQKEEFTILVAQRKILSLRVRRKIAFSCNRQHVVS